MTKAKNLTRDVEFLFEIGTMRHIQRTWKQFLNADFANLGEHTLRVTWIAMLIAKHEKVADIGKVAKLALVHDVAESRSVDVHYVSRQFATRHEPEAIAQTLGGTVFEKEFLELWHEVEAKETLESKIVKDADNLDVDLELREQASKGNTIGAKLAPMRKKVGATKLYTKTAKELWKLIQKADPHDWHWNSINRFTAGDWKK
jgi:putative hydrolases of HD superfamily